MSRELELITAATVADTRAGPRAASPGSGPKHAATHAECLNCGAPLHGPFCYACGQTADDHHRSILHLAWEAIESLTHLDGRLARTLPALFLRPGALARDHFEGRRQRHVPPIRLFFVCLLLFMLALETVVGRPGGQVAHPPRLGETVTVRSANGATSQVHIPSAEEISRAAGGRLTPAQVQAAASGSILGVRPRIRLGPRPADQGLASVQIDGRPGQTGDALDALALSKGKHSAFETWLVEHGRKAQASQEYFKSVAFEWAHRLAILLLPIFALLLTLCYAYKRRFYVYDHLVVSMHFLSFVFLLWGVAYVLPSPVQDWALFAAALWTPVNLFMTLRGAYGSSIVGAGVKTLALWSASVALFLALLLAILAVALGAM